MKWPIALSASPPATPHEEGSGPALKTRDDPDRIRIALAHAPAAGPRLVLRMLSGSLRIFTPWLAGDGNFTQLADALGLELQIEGVEVPVRPFSADILAKDRDGNFVVIENQFGKTNHDHLGKVLTYAATLNASAKSLLFVPLRRIQPAQEEKRRP